MFIVIIMSNIYSFYNYVFLSKYSKQINNKYKLSFKKILILIKSNKLGIKNVYIIDEN